MFIRLNLNWNKWVRSGHEKFCIDFSHIELLYNIVAEAIKCTVEQSTWQKYLSISFNSGTLVLDNHFAAWLLYFGIWLLSNPTERS